MYRIGVILILIVPILFLLREVGIVVTHRYGCPPVTPYVDGYDLSQPNTLSTLVPEIREPMTIVWNALTEFKKSEGHYPESLTNLKNGYLQEIPAPNWGTGHWEYDCFPEQDIFLLVVKEKESSYEGLYFTNDLDDSLKWKWDH